METLHKKLEIEEYEQEIAKVAKRNASILNSLKDEQTRLFIEYISLHIEQLNFAEIASYSAFQISKLIFDTQLKQVETHFQSLIQQKCSLQQFVIIMFKILNFSIEKSPYLLIGLREMFTSIAANNQFITYSAFFKYIIGQVVSSKGQANNTQFQIRFSENKKQDYLFHDKGIKNLFYSKQTKSTICLDRNSHQIKFYDREMKLTHRFTTNKDKHDNKNTIVQDIGYCQIYNKLGLILDDLTISIINIKVLLTSDILEFQDNPANEIVFKHNKIMKQIYYLEMWGRWITVSQENYIYKYDFDRSRPEDRMELVPIHIPDFDIYKIIEFTHLNYVAIIAGNQISFYNENFSIRQYFFSHGCDITTLRYSDIESKFFVSGNENIISILERERNSHDFKVKLFELGGKSKIIDFQIFIEIGIILVVDENSDLRLYDYNKKVQTQSISIKNIKKYPSNSIGISKISRNQFIVSEAYMLIFTLEKIAIEPEVEIKFSPYYYYDEIKELLYVSMNNHIYSVHLMRGQVEDEFTEINSNIGKQFSFFLGKNTHIFEINEQGNVFDLYLNDQKIKGENRNYKKKINISKIQGASYDQQSQFLIVWSNDKIYQLKNQGNNNFVLINYCEIKNGETIKQVDFSSNLYIFKVFLKSNTVYRINAFNLEIIESYKFLMSNSEKKQWDDYDQQILNYIDFTEYKLQILLCSGNRLIILSERKSEILKLDSLVKSKYKCTFTRIKYQKLEFKVLVKQKKPTQKILEDDELLFDDRHDKYVLETQHLLFAFDQAGMIAVMDISYFFQGPPKEKSSLLIKAMEEGRQGYIKGGKIHQQNLKSTERFLNINGNNMSTCLSIKNFSSWKAHQKQILQGISVYIEKVLVLTYSNDGFIKLWNQNLQCLFSLKMPNFYKFHWKMDEIEQSRCIKNIQLTKKLVNYFKHKLDSSEKQAVHSIISKTKNFKKQNPYSKINPLDPIIIEIQNRDVQDFMNKTSIFNNTIRKLSYQERNFKKKELTTTQRSESSPWKRNPKFVQFIQSIDKKHQKQKLPPELEKLRGSLDVKIQNEHHPSNYKINFLPSLEGYLPEPKAIQPTETIKLNSESSEQNFEACLYLKNKRIVNRSNKFDEIDKEFERKRMQHFKYIQNIGIIKMGKNEEIKMNYEPRKDNKGELIDNVKKIFDQHNKEVINTKKGRLIAMPKLHKIKKDDN